MWEVFFDFYMPSATWMYVSTLLLLGIFFEFHRPLSLRNLDLVVLTLFAPGLLTAITTGSIWAYAWIFFISVYFLVRLFYDSIIVRRPQLQPNLSPVGLVFAATVLFLMLAANIFNQPLTQSDLEASREVDDIAAEGLEADAGGDSAGESPGFPLLHGSTDRSDEVFVPDGESRKETRNGLLWAVLSRITALLAQALIVAAMLLIGGLHFRSWLIGLSSATVYLLLPYTSEMSGYVGHVLPGALLVWAVFVYRAPYWSGLLIGLAAGQIFYPLFLLPLWCVYYRDRRRIGRFLGGVGTALCLMILLLTILTPDWPTFMQHIRSMFGLATWLPDHISGFWAAHGATLRCFVIIGFIVFTVALTFRLRGGIEMLISGSAAIMLASQFWHAADGGLQMAWYLPLLLLTMLRPNMP